MASIAVTPDATTLEALDATAQLQATARTSNGNSITAVFNWTSAGTTVATISSAGLVTARGNGMTTVTVASGSVSQTVSVTVEQRLSQLVMSADTVMLNALGASSQLEVTPQDVNGHAMSAVISWGSSDDSIATVDASDGSGVVTIRGVGETAITLMAGDRAVSATVIGEFQATFGQEVFGFTETNRHPAQNYGRDVAFPPSIPILVRRKNPSNASAATSVARTRPVPTNAVGSTCGSSLRAQRRWSTGSDGRSSGG
ncbi:MAG: Ig-like domain-containing protein [Rhodospirillales bacterium]|nr:Ig-like domain-containing protein [Rhodospirillales bacterium]